MYTVIRHGAYVLCGIPAEAGIQTTVFAEQYWFRMTLDCLSPCLRRDDHWGVNHEVITTDSL